MTTSRDFEAEYLAACIADRTAADIAGRAAAQRKMASVDRAADKAGVRLDVLGIDEQARTAISA
jgi:hypothetical protein